jgi:hypothetical protein
MTSTASFDNGTGEPIPMSCPVSRGRSFPSFTRDVASDLVNLSELSGNSEGGRGADRTSLGVRSTPPFPRFSPWPDFLRVKLW